VIQTPFCRRLDFSDWNGDVLAVAVTEKDLSKDSDSGFENAVLKKLDGQLGGLLSAAAAEDFAGTASVISEEQRSLNAAAEIATGTSF
jgi:hypothetical protein